MKFKKVYLKIFLWVYLIFLAWVLYLIRSGEDIQTGYNLVPLKNIKSMVFNYLHYGHGREVKTVLLINLVGNLLLFFPVGYLVLKAKVVQNLFTSILLAFFSIILIEITQYFFKLGIADIDDFILNWIGWSFGSFTYKIFK